MKKILSIATIFLIVLSTLSTFTPSKVKAEPSVDISAQYSSFVSAYNNYKRIFGQDVAIGQTVDRTLSGIINDPPAHYSWHSWAGQTYPDPPDGFSIRIETIQPNYVYKIIGMGYMGGSQPSASGWIQVNSPFRIEQINYMINASWPSPWGTCYDRIYMNTDTGRIDFSAKWYNWPALIDASAFGFAIIIAVPGSTLPPFSYDTTRVLASHAYNIDTSRVVMFAGTTWNSSDYRSDVWAIDPTTSQWTAVSASSGPSGRFAASMDYSTVAKNFLVFGGGTISGEVSDTWTFQFTGPNTGIWTQIAGTAPSPRSGAPMVYDPKSNLFVLFGGEQYVYSLGDTWVFDPSANTWSNRNPSSSPPQRARATMAYDAKSGKVLLFGGLNKGAGSLSSDTWLYDAATNTWQQVATSTAPSARQWPSLACDGNGIFYLFGGWRVDAGGGLGQYLGDTWKFDMTTMQWTQLFPSESPIAQSQGALMHIDSGKFVLMGGWRDSPLGEVWVYDSSQNVWSIGPFVVNQPPVADFRYRGPKTSFTPSTIYAGSEVKFDAEPSYDPDGIIVSYRWSFGDGAFLTTADKVVYHTYVSSGPYTVTLTVTDDKDATGSISKNIFINPLNWEIYFEIDYMTGHKPTDSVLEYIHGYFRDNGIYVYFFVDDEISPADPSVTRNEFWQYEATYNDVWKFDDRAHGDIAQGKYNLKEKWILFGTVSEENPTASGYSIEPNKEYGNYIFIADQANDQWASSRPVSTAEVETVALMHEIGHTIGILLLSKSGSEAYDNVGWSVMAELSVMNCIADPIRYSPRYWKEKNLDYYII